MRCAALADHPQTFALGPQAEHWGEVVARGDLELAVDVAQVPLDRLDRDELALRDLPVGQSLGGERRHAVLARGERLAAREQTPVASRTSARRHELLVCAIGQAADAR